MNDNHGQISFFMGANTPNGFVSLFDELYDPKDKSRCYIIKGGPGTGKSSLMKSVAKKAEELGLETEYIYCSSDPNSLDAVILPELNTCLADGTSPHVIEPKYPGACEVIINLGDYYDAEQLYDNSEEIISLSDECSLYHKKCVHFLASSALLANDCSKLYYSILDFDKIKRYASRIASREFYPTANETGYEEKRFLSAVTPEGVFTHNNTLPEFCSRYYVFHDDSDLIASLILSMLRELALDAGMHIITCHCPLSPYEKIEHIIIPELELGFITSNSYHTFELENSKAVHTKRFCDADSLSGRKQRIGFNRKTQDELINESINYLKLAKQTHDKLEKFYISAMDFKGVNERTEMLIEEIFGFLK